MKQQYSYEIIQLGAKDSSILNEKDRNLVESYQLGIQSFNPNESRLDVIVSDLDGNVLETYTDSSDYSVRGVMQGADRVNQLEVNPTLYFENRTFIDNTIVVEYRAYNNLYGKGAELYVAEISADRTEVRLKSISVSPRDLQYYTNKLQLQFNEQSYFAEAFLEVAGVKVPIVNALTEVVPAGIVATFKLYEPLPNSIEVKDTCQVLESLGESSRFSVKREVVVVEDPVPELKGPNFAVEVGTSTIVTNYSNYTDLLSQKSWETSKGLYTAFKQANLHTSVDYTDFSDFVHFSSAVERLENARYKFEMIFDLQNQLDTSPEPRKLVEEIDGIIANFDHYENYLYFEGGEYAWPKKVDPATELVIRPYILEDDPRIYEPWYESMYQRAEGYDLNNKDILISTIPAAIREDLDHNEPYLIFIHMIGQHFDDLWIYARAITDRYKADNRPDFGISKELVKEAVESFGLNLYESNQNLTGLFDLCQPDGTYDSGLEKYVDKYRSARASYVRENSTDESGSIITGSWEQAGDIQEDVYQPVQAGTYTKEVYKRIYHNIPTLLKTRGTSRGLRVLLNCFGIPSDILSIKVQGGVEVGNRPFFGPEESIKVSPEFESGSRFEVSGSVDKVRLGTSEPVLEFHQVDGTGSFFDLNVLSRYVTVTGSSDSPRTDDLHKVEVGFDLNEEINRLFRESLVDFTVDEVIGDPRNTLEQYGDVWKYWREHIIQDPSQFRSPAAIIRLVRYFDTTLFRMLQDFVPARASISTGAIVKDNILHRNRWKGVGVSWKVVIESGSTTGSKASGSHAGAFRDAGTGTPVWEDGKVKWLDSEVVSTGGSYTVKEAYSGSRELNGQLSGSYLQVSDGELNDGNPYKKAGQPRNRYGLNVLFLDLPDLPLCTSKAQSNIFSEYWEFNVLGTSSVKAYLDQVFDIRENTTMSAFTPEPENPVAFVQTHWTGSEHLVQLPVESSFMGWYLNGNPVTPSCRIDLEPYKDRADEYRWEARYSSASRDVLWFCTIRPTGDYYYTDDLLITWKWLPSGSDPRSSYSESGSATPWTSPSNITLRLSNDSEIGHCKLPASALFGIGEGYFWVGISSASVSQFEGVESIGDKFTPYMWQGKVVDTQWCGNAGEWPRLEWEINTGSASPVDERGDNWEDYVNNE